MTRPFYRAVRLSLHLLRAMAATALVLPFASPAYREDLLRNWSIQALELLHVHVRRTGTLPPAVLPKRLIVCNHISWLDILLVSAQHPGRFVAKRELRDWPIIGWLAARAGTVFLRRGWAREVHRAAKSIAVALHQGEAVTIFPEGTTSDGASLLPFHAGLFEAAVLAQAEVCPCALRYERHDGRRNLAPAFTGDLSLVASIWRVLKEETIYATMQYAAPLRGGQLPRAELADSAYLAIHRLLVAPSLTPPQVRPERDVHVESVAEAATGATGS